MPGHGGLNGLFTVVGGLLSVIISALFGFLDTISVALVIYLIAFFIFYKIRRVYLSGINQPIKKQNEFL